jgi:hypothetical protein
MSALGGEAPQRLGDIILKAIDEYAGESVDPGLVDQYVLFGDPAVMLK